MSAIRPATMCGLFKPGHTPHWIQMRRAVEDRVDTPVPGRLIGLLSATSIAVEVDGREFSLWNHERERLAETAVLTRSAVEYQPRWGLLWVPTTNGRYAFCIARTRENFVHCPETPPTGRPSELLRSAGGFSTDLTRAKDDRSFSRAVNA